MMIIVRIYISVLLATKCLLLPTTICAYDDDGDDDDDKCGFSL